MVSYGDRPDHASIVETYPCPKCGAQPGEPCTTVDGGGREMRHVAVMHSERLPQARA
jgi:hypothetical protein